MRGTICAVAAEPRITRARAARRLASKIPVCISALVCDPGWTEQGGSAVFPPSAELANGLHHATRHRIRTDRDPNLVERPRQRTTADKNLAERLGYPRDAKLLIVN